MIVVATTTNNDNKMDYFSLFHDDIQNVLNVFNLLFVLQLYYIVTLSSYRINHLNFTLNLEIWKVLQHYFCLPCSRNFSSRMRCHITNSLWSLIRTCWWTRLCTPQGAAVADGRLKRGDQIIAVNGHCLEGVTHAEAVDILKKTKGSVVLTVLSWDLAHSVPFWLMS